MIRDNQWGEESKEQVREDEVTVAAASASLSHPDDHVAAMAHHCGRHYSRYSDLVFFSFCSDQPLRVLFVHGLIDWCNWNFSPRIGNTRRWTIFLEAKMPYGITAYQLTPVLSSSRVLRGRHVTPIVPGCLTQHVVILVSLGRNF